jgi:hypothetical protein
MDNPETQDEDKQNKKTQNNMWRKPLCSNKQNNVSKTRALLQTTGGKDEPIQPSSNICICK